MIYQVKADRNPITVFLNYAFRLKHRNQYRGDLAYILVGIDVCLLNVNKPFVHCIQINHSFIVEV